MDTLSYKIGLLTYKSEIFKIWASVIGSIIIPIILLIVVFIFRIEIKAILRKKFKLSIGSMSLETDEADAKEFVKLEKESEPLGKKVEETSEALKKETSDVERAKLVDALSSQIKKFTILQSKIQELENKVFIKDKPLVKIEDDIFLDDNGFKNLTNRQRDRLMAIIQYLGIDNVKKLSIDDLKAKFYSEIYIPFSKGGNYTISDSIPYVKVGGTLGLMNSGIVDSAFQLTDIGAYYLKSIAKRIRT